MLFSLGPSNVIQTWPLSLTINAGGPPGDCRHICMVGWEGTWITRSFCYNNIIQRLSLWIICLTYIFLIYMIKLILYLNSTGLFNARSELTQSSGSFEIICLLNYVWLINDQTYCTWQSTGYILITTGIMNTLTKTFLQVGY